MWVFDLESNGLLYDATRIWCGVFKNIKTKEVKKYRPDDIDEMIDWLKAEQPILIGHNIIGFDLPLLEKLYGFVHKNKSIDTLIISKLHNPDRTSPPHCPNKKAPHSLQAWGYRVGRGKPEHEDWSVFSEEMLHRCSEDVEITELVYKELMKEGKKYNWKHAYQLSHKLFYILNKQQEYGWKVNEKQINHNLSLLRTWKRRIKDVLQPHLPLMCEIEEGKDGDEYKYVKKPFLKSGKYAKVTTTFLEKSDHPIPISGPFCRVNFRRISLDKPFELKDFLLESGWEPREWNLNDKGERTSPKLVKDDPFHGVEGKIGRLICRYIQCKHREATINGWLNNIRPDGRIPSVITSLANTGRAKHSVIVNVPGGDSFFGKQMRKIFSCSEDKILIGCDAAGCQNRMLAARVKDEFFTNTLLHGKKEDKTSIHFVNQKAFKDRGYDVPYNMCKNLNYGTLFGASNTKLGRMIGGTEKDGEQIREAILGVAPGFKQVVEELTEEWKSNAKVKKNDWGKAQYHDGWITGLDGRPIFISSEHAILVYALQSDEAIMMQVAYCYVYKWLIEKGYKWGEDWAFVNWNHDEFTIECKEEYALEISKIMEYSIYKAGRYFKLDCDQEGDADIGCDWWEIH